MVATVVDFCRLSTMLSSVPAEHGEQDHADQELDEAEAGVRRLPTARATSHRLSSA